jgi:hypothetical protein
MAFGGSIWVFSEAHDLVGSVGLLFSVRTLGLLFICLGSLLLSGVVRTVATPLAVLLSCSAIVGGWQCAISDELITLRKIGAWMFVLAAAGTVALVFTLVNAVRELRRSSFYRMLLGHCATWGRVTNGERLDKHGLQGTVHFDDVNGVRHSVRTLVPRDALKRPIRVYYDPARPDDVKTLRVGMPVQPMSAVKRDAIKSAVRAALPLPRDA